MLFGRCRGGEEIKIAYGHRRAAAAMSSPKSHASERTVRSILEAPFLAIDPELFPILVVSRTKHRARKSSGPWKCETFAFGFCGAARLKYRDTFEPHACTARYILFSKNHALLIEPELDLTSVVSQIRTRTNTGLGDTKPMLRGEVL